MEMRGYKQIRANRDVQLSEIGRSEKFQIAEIPRRVEDRVLERRLGEFGMQSINRNARET